MTTSKTSKKRRRSYTPEQKAAILRRHLVDKVSVADLCDEYKLQPSVFYGWQQRLFANLEAAIDPGDRRRDSAQRQLERDNESLRAKLAKKDGVIAEIAAEMVGLKKELGEP
jgi:transposase